MCRVGHYHRLGEGWPTGTTVVVATGGAVGGVDVRGGAPGTRETDLLDPSAMVERVHAVCLTGGSAYGLAAADGVMCWLGRARHRATRWATSPTRSCRSCRRPCCSTWPAAWGHRPDASFGYQACAAASDGPVAEGTVGAGTGATAGPVKGGIGTASVVLDGDFTVAALVALNARGHAVDPHTGVPYGIGFGLGDEFAAWRPPDAVDVEAARERLQAAAKMPRLNTTLVIVATDATLTKAECTFLAGVAQDGVARAVRPTHTLFDGDIVFALATATRPLELRSTDAYDAGPSRAALVNDLAAAGADTVTRAVVRAVLAATTVGSSAAYRDLFPTGVVGNTS